MKNKKIKIVLIVAICLLVIFVAWGIAGRIALDNVKKFEHGDQEKYALYVKKYGNNIDSRIDVHYKEEGENVLKLLNDELKYKSMRISFPWSTSYALQLYQEYNHFYIDYYRFGGENVHKNYVLNISSQENSSYIDYDIGIFDIRIWVKHDDDLPDYLEGLFD